MSCVQYVLSFGGRSVMVCREMCGVRSVVVPFGDGSVMVCREICGLSSVRRAIQ